MLVSREVNVLRVIRIFMDLTLDLFSWVIRRRFVPNYVWSLGLSHQDWCSILIVDQELIAAHWLVVLNCGV